MKSLRFINYGLFVIILSSIFAACSKQISFEQSSLVPAARGDVRVKMDDNKNYNIKIFIRNLAEISRLGSSKKAYIVWLETDQHPPINVGKIDSDNKMFSHKLKASFTTVSATKPTKVFITAEDDVTTQYPTSQPIITTTTF